MRGKLLEKVQSRSILLSVEGEQARLPANSAHDLLHSALRMRHEPDDITLTICHTSDTVERAIHVHISIIVADIAARIAVPKHYLPVLFNTLKRRRISEIIPLKMGYWTRKNLADSDMARVERALGLHFHVDKS
jgi:hypothetical protein